MKANKKIEFFLIGAQKAGTTTLYNWLSQHPEINAPQSVKDLHFFSKNENLKKGFDWLHKQYKNDNQAYMLDGSVNYLCQSMVPERIHKYNSNAKFLIVLRDPVKRAYSAYQFFKKLCKEKRGFAEAIEMELNGESGVWNDRDNFAYIDHGFYHRQLCKWHNHFEKERFHILLYEELFATPEKFLPSIFQFLNVEVTFNPIFQTKNKTGSVKYKWLNTMIYGEGKVRNTLLRTLKLKHLLPASWRLLVLNKFRDWNTRKGIASETLAIEEYKQLSKIFEEDTQKLSELLQRDLSHIWTY